MGGISGFLFKSQSEKENRFTHLLGVVGGIAGILFSLYVLLTGQPYSLEIASSLPVGFFCLGIDRLSAFFIFVISFISLPASLFAVGYIRAYQGKRNLALLGFFYHSFLLAMLLLVSVRNAFYFLFFWELMSLASYFLVIFEHEKPEARSAGTLYLIMTHVGTAFITAAFWLLFVHTGSFSFEIFRQAAATLSPVFKNAIFLSALIGFGTKAGMIPLHIWLPRAHPQAPSHVSALMSGVMIKTAIYGLLRFFFNFLGEVPIWWGPVVLVLAILSTLLGVLYALMEHDIKRLLAFHSIENIGIILLGIGMALIFTSIGQPVYVSLALIAALYHVMNHATFKGLLFLGAGAVYSKTHTRNIEELGGLIKTMPWTAFCFLVGSVAISALPPLNGFVSEWLTFIALLLGSESAEVSIRFFSPILAALLGLAGALAATCFVKAFGISFLGLPRSREAAHAREVSGSMKASMGILAAGCLGFALAAPWIVKILGKTAQALSSAEISMETLVQKSFLVSPLGPGQFSPFLVAFVLFVLMMGTVIFLRIFFGRKQIRMGPSWDCGMPCLEPRMQYTATGYSKPLRRIFSFLYQPTRRVELETEGYEMLRTAQRFESSVTHLFDDRIYRPLGRLMSVLSRKAKRIQTGHIQLYLSYIFITLIILLLVWGGLS